MDVSLQADRITRPRLLRHGAKPETLAEYEATGGYSVRRSHSDLLAMIERSGLRGRGGAAFPLATKLASVAAGGPCVVIGNGEEGEPASVKDRWMLRNRPHQVIDGLVRVADAVDACRRILYISDSIAAQHVSTAIDELGDRGRGIEIVTVAASYVAGEETSAVRAVNGGPPLPTDKPPRPFERGVDELPTAVCNVETLAHVAWLAQHGVDAFRSVGTPTSPGTFLSTISGGCGRPGLYEQPLGIRLGEALDRCGGVSGQPRGFLMGGFFAGVLAPEALDIPLDYDVLRSRDSGLGCGSIVVLGPEDCPVAAVADVMGYLAGQSAQQCGACIRGTAAMGDVLVALGRGEVSEQQLDKLRGWSTSLLRRGACGLLDGAAYVAASLLREFPAEVDAHQRHPCSACVRLIPAIRQGDTRFRVSVEEMTQEVCR